MEKSINIELKRVLFKEIFKDWNCVAKWEITDEKTTVWFERFNNTYSEVYDTEKLFLKKK